MLTLNQFLSEYEDKHFSWSDNNCCTFVSQWIINVTGKDLMLELNKKYCNENTAKLLTEQVGGIIKEASKILEGKEIILGNVRGGDIICGFAGEGDTMGVCVGVKTAFLTEYGIKFLRTSKMKKAWRVL